MHVRYYVTEIVDVQLKRTQRSERLCTTDNEHHSVTCRPVKQLAVQVMDRINALASVITNADVSVTEFWEKTHLPHVEKTTKPSTLNGYKAIWRQNLAAVFARFNLRDYQTHHATRYLTSLRHTTVR
jgi:hypothetical protein